MKFETYRFEDITINFDKMRVPLSTMERARRPGEYRYYGAQGVIDYIDDYICDGQYLLIAEDGENLKSKKLPIAYLVEGKFWVNNHAHIIKANDKCVLEYLYYLMNYIDLSGYITGSAQPKLSQKNMNSIEFKLPNIEVQKKIVSVLGRLDGKIKYNEQINENLLEQINALYDEFSTRSNWDIATINDIAEKIAMGPFGSNIKVSTFVDDGVPIISGNHLRGYFLEEPSFNYITEKHAERLKNSVVYPKDIIFTHAGNIGQVAMIPIGCNYQKYVLSQRQFYLRCNTEKVLPEYVTLFFHSVEGQHELLSYANQTGVPSLAQPATNLKKIKIPLPPIGEQLKWNETISSIIELYQVNVQETKRLTQLRDTILPKLMSGELDVSNVSI